MELPSQQWDFVYCTLFQIIIQITSPTVSAFNSPGRPDKRCKLIVIFDMCNVAMLDMHA